MVGVTDVISGGSIGLLDKERTVASEGFNRWLVPPAALCIHLRIGMAYGFSVFSLPLSKALGIAQPVACAAGTSWFSELFVTNCDWSVSALTFTFTLFIVLVGLLVMGMVCNALVRPVAAKWFMTDAELAAERKLAHDAAIANAVGTARSHGGSPTPIVLVYAVWIAIAIPVAWGVSITLQKVAALF